MPTEQEVLTVLSQIQDPDLHRDIVALGFIKNLKISATAVSFEINLTTPACPVKDKMQLEAKELVSKMPGVTEVVVTMTAEVRRTMDLDKTGLKGVKNIIAVGSGKGGVGKSTVAVNLAVAMAKTGAKVGLLDGDIYGPCVPIMMGPGAKIDVRADEKIIPASAHGIKFMSMGFFAPGDKPLIWRGPMVHHAISQSLHQVLWEDLDYLFIDLPPGTGDAHLTLVQSATLTGAVLVSTPQDVGLTIAMKTYQMFVKVRVRILGIIENMSYHTCVHCGEREEIFGHGGVRETAKRLGMPFLGEIPLIKKIREQADLGIPIVISDPDSLAAQVYTDIAKQLAAQISIASFQAPQLKIIEEAVH